MAKVRFKSEWFWLGLIIFSPRLLGLDLFLTADEPLFLDHARQFGQALASGDWAQTLGIGYPGVTVAGWTAPVVYLARTELEAYTAGRAATAVLNGLLLLSLYGVAQSLLGRWPALIGVALLALDPYSLAYSRLLQVDAPLGYLMTLSGLSFLLWLQRDQTRWAVLSGVFAGLALLTKSTALLLGPMLGVIWLGWMLAAWPGSDRGWWFAKIKGGLLIILSTVLIFWGLWPAMWVDPVNALGLTFGKLFNDQEAGTGNLGMFWLGRFVEDPGPLFYPAAFILKATPWLVVGLALSLIYCVASHRYLSQATPAPLRAMGDAPDVRQYPLRLTFWLWLFTLTYLLSMTIASKKSVRYMLPAFPGFYLLAGLAFYQFGLFWRKYIEKWRGQLLAHTVTALFTLSLLSLAILLTSFYHPYYLTYYNPLVLGWRWAPQTILIGWGEGLDEAARYLNQQPAQRVAAWYEWLFPLFYRAGEVQAVIPQENLITADRAVLYINQVQRDIPGPQVIHYFQTRRQPEYTVRLAGIDYAWVYPGPIAGFHLPDTPAYPFVGEFGGEARLLGYKLHPQLVKGGAALIVTLYWQSLAAPAADRFVYARLVDAAGRIWARGDSPPVMGLWPTTRWQPGMVVEDAQELPIPAGTPPGVYRLEVGLYDPGSGQPLAATGQPVGQGGGLLLGEVTVEWQAWPQAEAELARQTDILLAPEVRLVGYEAALLETATQGDILPIRLAWRASASLNSAAAERYVIDFEWLQGGLAQLHQSDEFALPVSEWGGGALMLTQHDLIAPPELMEGEYELAVALHPPGQDPTGPAFPLGRVTVAAPPRQFELPAAALPPAGAARLEQGVTLAGYELTATAQILNVALYWQPGATLTSSYQVFAQLLTAENNVAAQSDAVPATGRRPTTGWLGGEVIRDAHRLVLPADLRQPGQKYRLIAGLYDPHTGRRLAVLDEAGTVVADAVVVTEVSLP